MTFYGNFLTSKPACSVPKYYRQTEHNKFACEVAVHMHNSSCIIHTHHVYGKCKLYANYVRCL